jgi:hypothetical protein
MLFESILQRGDSLLPFEEITCLRSNPTATKIQFVTVEEMQAMDQAHLSTLIRAKSRAMAQEAMLDVMRRV